MTAWTGMAIVGQRPNSLTHTAAEPTIGGPLHELVHEHVALPSGYHYRPTEWWGGEKR